MSLEMLSLAGQACHAMQQYVTMQMTWFCTKESRTVQNSFDTWSYSDAPCAFKKTLMSMYMCLGFQKTVQKSLSCKYAPVPSIMSLPLCLR